MEASRKFSHKLAGTHRVYESVLDDIVSHIRSNPKACTPEFYDQLAHLMYDRYTSASRYVLFGNDTRMTACVDGHPVTFTHHFGLSTKIMDDHLYLLVRVPDAGFPEVDPAVALYSKKRHNPHWNSVMAQNIVGYFMLFAHGEHEAIQS